MLAALERGAPQIALTHAKQCVRLLRHAWMYTEEGLRRQNSRAETSQSETDKLADEISQLSMSTIKMSTTTANYQFAGSVFWDLITPLFRGLSYLSSLYAHHGMFQETMYYAEQAHKLVTEVGSELHTAMASAYLGSTWLKAGNLEKGSEFLKTAHLLCTAGDRSRETVLLTYHLGNMHGRLGDRDAEVAAYEDAETALNGLTEPDFINTIDRLVGPTDVLEKKMASLTVSKRKVAAPRKTRARSTGVVKKKTTIRAKSPVEVTSTVAEECPQLISLKPQFYVRKHELLHSCRDVRMPLSFYMRPKAIRTPRQT